MKVTAVYAGIKKVVSSYRAALSAYADQEFTRKHDEITWSPAEVYHHVFDLSILTLDQIAGLIAGEGVSGEASLAGKAILFSGAFPPGLRFKVPQRLEGRVKGISLAEATDMMDVFEQRLEEIYPDIMSADQLLTVKHPRLGFFNTLQWLRFTEVHLKHHFKQLKRIKKAAESTI